VNYLKNSVLVVLALTTIGGAALAWRQYQELVELRAAALNANERSELQKKIWALQQSNRTLEDQLAAAQAKKLESRDAGPGDDTPAPETRPTTTPFRRGFDPERMAAMRELMAKPEVQALLTTERKGLVDAQYAALFRNLNLTPDQLDKLRTLLADRQNAIQDVFAAAREQDINPRTDPQAFQKLVADAQQPIEDGIKSLLGDNGYNQLTNYEQTMPQRNIVNVLQQRLSSSNTPLTPAQSDQLVQILATDVPSNYHPPTNGSGNLGFTNRLTTVIGGMGIAGAGTLVSVGPGSAPITNQAVTDAQTVLSSDQLNALQQLQQQQQAAQQLQKLLRSTRNTGGTAPAPATAPTPGH
jgi:hypothetical protein